MTTYIIIAVLSVILSLLVRNTKGKRYLISLFVVFLPLFLFGVLRSDCMDMNDYELFYKDANGSRFWTEANERIEYGWAFLNYIMPNFFSLILLQTSLLVFSYIYVCKKYISPLYLALFILLLFLSGDKTVYFLTAMRNTMAIALLLFSLPLIEERKLTHFAVLTLVASLFHTSALIFFPLIYIVGRNSEMTSKEVCVWLIVLVLFLILPVDELVSQVAVLISGNVFEKYSSYLETTHENGVMAKLSSVIFSAMILFDLSRTPIDKKHLMLGRIALLFFYFPLLGSLNIRGSQYICVSLLLYSVYAISQRRTALRVCFTIMLIVYLAYAFFVIDASSPYSGLSTYQTLMDNLW